MFVNVYLFFIVAFNTKQWEHDESFQFSSVRCWKQARGMGLYFQNWKSRFFVGFCVPSGSVMVKWTYNMYKGGQGWSFGLEWGSGMGELASLGCTPSYSRSCYSFYCSLVTICQVPRAEMTPGLASLRCTPCLILLNTHTFVDCPPYTYLTCCPIVANGIDGRNFWGHPLLVVVTVRGYWPPIVTGNVQLSWPNYF